MKPISIGIIGAAKHNWQFLAECLKSTPTQIVAVADEDPDARTRFAEHYRAGTTYADAVSLLDGADPEALLIFPGAAEILPTALAAIERGVSIFTDKHLARSPDEVAALRSALERSPVTVRVRLNKPLVPAYRTALALIGRDDGIGRPLTYSSDFHAGPYGSLANFVNNHILFHYDLARAAIGDFTVRSVLANRTGEPTVAVIVTFESERGAIGVINASSYSPGETPKERLEVVGTHGVVRVENARRVHAYRGIEASPLFTDDFGLSWEEPGAQLASNTRNGYEEQVSSFVEAVALGKREWEPTLHRLAHHIARLEETWRLLEGAGVTDAS
jgi:predicted dehydrogenase